LTRVVHAPAAFRGACDEARAAGRRVGLVPTMGALHAGHLALVDAAATAGADFRVTTVFVNPLQFGEGEDLDRYPRTLDADVEACRARGVDLVFAPASDAMYAEGFQTQVRVGELTRSLEGEFRPGHFEGVTTVVAKLFLLSGPCVAVFGRKDYQQWRVISRMVRDLGFPVEVLGHPIVREDDGLALSSRNRYLSPEDRGRALALSRGLRAADRRWREGERDAATLREVVLEALAAADSVDYAAIADPESLRLHEGAIEGDAVALVAAHVGGTRLIDNLVLGE